MARLQEVFLDTGFHGFPRTLALPQTEELVLIRVDIKFCSRVFDKHRKEAGMQKQSIIVIGLLALLAMVFAGCIQPLTPLTDTGQDAEVEAHNAEPQDAEDMAGEETTLYVGPTQADCVGVGPMTCMLVKQEPDGEYQFFYSQIEGFEYVPGTEYELLVNVEEVADPPADGSSLTYTLIEVVSATEVGPTLEGTPWQLVALADQNGAAIEVLSDVEVTALFEDERVSGSDGCNNYAGSYSVDGVDLTVGPDLMGTMMACPGPIMDQAGAYTAALTSAARYAIVDDQLRILNDTGRVVVTYEVRVPTSLTGTTWQAIGYNNGNEAVVSIAIDTEITAIFGEDGTLSGSAGCNNYTAAYEADDVNIEIGPAAVNMMMCAEPEGIMEQESLYLAALSMAEVYSIDGDRLQLRTGEGSLVADYRPTDADSDSEDTGAAQLEIDQPAVVEAPLDADALTKSLANMAYKSEYTADGTAPLTDGTYSEEAAPGSATKIEVSLTDQGAIGELNGQPAAAVVLVTSPGGSGTFYDLAVVMERDGKPVNVATTNLGDRVQVNSVAIEDDQIIVDMVQSGPDDPMCCPTQQVINTYALEGDELSEVSSNVVSMDEESDESPASADVEAVDRDGIVGVEWHFFEFQSGDGSQIFVDDPNRYLLTLNSDGTANVKADCNSGSGSYQLDGSSLTVDIVAVTRALCPPDSLSDDYLRLLGDVVTYVETDDVLALNLMMDAGNMLFQLEEATADQAHQPTQLIAQDAITVDPGSLATSYHWQVLPPTPYDASMPPVPVGQPARAVVTFDYLPAPTALADGGPYIVVYPIDEYVKLWQDAGNDAIVNTVAGLQTLMDEQPADPASPMPILPPPGAVNDLAVQAQYIDFVGGSGVRFVGRLAQDASPIFNTQTDYYFQGLTDDGRFYVSVRWPVETSALPDSMEQIAPDQQQAIESNIETYLQQATESLNVLESADWSPDLAELDALVNSLTVEAPASE
jgi:heat shock protein HslJ